MKIYKYISNELVETIEVKRIFFNNGVYLFDTNGKPFPFVALFWIGHYSPDSKVCFSLKKHIN